RVPQVFVGFACAVLVSGCASGPSVGSSMPRGAWSVVALGDSGPYGSNCGVTPHPQLSASSLTAPPTREVTATNDALAGFTTEDVLAQLRSDPDVVSHVRQAAVVEIELDPTDVAYSGSCATKAYCYQPMIPAMRQNLAEIVA